MTQRAEMRPELARFAARLPLLRRAWSSRHSDERPMTQERLAEEVGVDARSVREWEHGRQRPRTFALVDRIATVLEVSHEEVGLGTGVMAPTCPHPRERLALALGASGQLEARLAVVDDMETAYAAIGLDRRDFLCLIGTLLVALPGSGMETAERVIHGLSSPRRRIDVATVEAMEQLTTYLCQEGPRIPVDQLLPDVKRHMELLAGMEPALQPSAVQRRLVACIGRTARLISGMMMWDLVDLAGAQAYQDIALRAAREADDFGLAALTMAERSEVVTSPLMKGSGDRETGRDRTAEALQLAETAQSYASRGPAATQVHVLLMGATLYADAGREADFRRLHDAAQGLFDSIGGDEVWTGSIFITRARLLSYEGRGLRLLGLSHAAEAVVNAALAELESDSRNAKYRCFVYGDRAAALLQREDPEVDEGCRCISEMLDMAVRLRRATGVSNARALHTQLQPWSDTVPVRELTEKLAAVSFSHA
jgi:transcriptional regulator with XRE-family HTH domain